MTTAAYTYAHPALAAAQAMPYDPRPTWYPVPFALALPLPLMSYFMGGVQTLNSIAWVVITVVCALYCIMELVAFPRRFGIGGIVLYGGSLIWFCADYFKYWFGGLDYSSLRDTVVAGFFNVSLDTVARATGYHLLFLFMASVGLLMPIGRWICRLIAATPQPANPQTLLNLTVVMFLFGILPFFLFIRKEYSPLEAMWTEMTSFRVRSDSPWAVGRSGHANVNLGGYVMQWLWVGRVAGVMAAFYAIYMTRSHMVQALCWSMWFFQFMLAFGSGTRGWVVFMALPVVGMYFVKHNAHAAASGAVGYARWKPYLIGLLMAAIMFAVIQVQGWNRTRAMSDLSFDLQQLADPIGNDMFSASLFVFDLVPEQRRHYVYDSIDNPAAAWVMPMPTFFARFFIDIIPRALWPGKPVGAMWAEVNERWAGTGGNVGTTKAPGIVGSWYGNYGLPGVLQGGFLFGWLLALFDRALVQVRRKPLIIMLIVCLQVFMFRRFRGWGWNEVYPLVVGMGALWLLSLFAIKQSNDDRTGV